MSAEWLQGPPGSTMATDLRAETFTSFFVTATKGFTPHRWQLQVALDGRQRCSPFRLDSGRQRSHWLGLGATLPHFDKTAIDAGHTHEEKNRCR